MEMLARIGTALDSEIGAALADAIGANPTVKSFGAEAREEERFAKTADAWRWAGQWGRSDARLEEALRIVDQTDPDSTPNDGTGDDSDTATVDTLSVPSVATSRGNSAAWSPTHCRAALLTTTSQAMRSPRIRTSAHGMAGR